MLSFSVKLGAQVHSMYTLCGAKGLCRAVVGHERFPPVGNGWCVGHAPTQPAFLGVLWVVDVVFMKGVCCVGGLAPCSVLAVILCSSRPLDWVAVMHAVKEGLPGTRPHSTSCTAMYIHQFMAVW
jgi:hypothetical protein